MRTELAALCFTASAVFLPCRAKAEPAEPSSRDSREMEPVPLPPKTSEDDAPPPLAEPNQPMRAPIELTAGAALAFGDCVEHLLCTGGGYTFSLMGLWRSVPWFAWGASIVVQRGADTPLNTPKSVTSFTYLYLSARLYPLEQGALEPYLSLDLGTALVPSPAKEGSKAGASASASGGLDVFLDDRVRAGAFVGVSSSVFATRGYGRAYRYDFVSAGARLTVELGDPL
ncbi:MAG TPA: hypothetical protein VGJ84_23875 [Polyangiaceae bacterium]